MKKNFFMFMAGILTVSILSDSVLYAEQTKDDLWAKFLKYDLCITNYNVLTDDEKDLCHFIFDTEQSSDESIRCERARRILAHDENIGERITLEQLNDEYGIWDRYSPNKVGWESYIHCVPDIKGLDSYNLFNEYWLDDAGTVKVRFTGECCNAGMSSDSVFDSFVVINEADNTVVEIEPKKFSIGKWEYKCPDMFWWGAEEGELNLNNAVEYEGNYYYITNNNEAIFLKSGECLDSYETIENAEPITEPLILPKELNGCPLIAIEEEAFWYSPYTEIVLPESLKFIDRNAFTGCPYIEKVNFPKGLEYIGSGIFRSCSFIKIDIDCPNLKISDGAFSSCGVTDANINAESIGEGAFRYCTYLENITFGENIKRIDADAFRNIINVKSIMLPKSLKVLGSGAFKMDDFITEYYGKSNLKTIEIPGSVEVIGALPKATGEIILTGIGNPGKHPLTEEQPCTFNSDCVIYGYNGTETERYAKEWNLKFETLESVTGDLNFDGELNISDVVTLKKYLVKKEGFTNEQWKLADLNNDGNVNVFDVIILKRKILKV